MDAPYCDVIGCRARACWMVVRRDDCCTSPLMDEYLCDAHAQQFDRNPAFAECFAPLEAVVRGREGIPVAKSQ